MPARPRTIRPYAIRPYAVRPYVIRAAAVAASTALALSPATAAPASATAPAALPGTASGTAYGASGTGLAATPSPTPAPSGSATRSPAIARPAPAGTATPGTATPGAATPGSPAPAALATPTPAPTAPQPLRLTPEQRKLIDSVDVRRVHEHLQAFQRIADAHGGNRAAGSPGYLASRDYVADRLRRAGYQVTVQPFEFGYFKERSAVLEQVAPRRVRYTHSPQPQAAPKEGEPTGDFATMVYSGSGDVTAPVHPVDVTLPPAKQPSSTSGCQRSDFAGFPRGAIALIQRGTCEFAVKAKNAQDAGAAAVIIFNEGQPDRSDLERGSLKEPGITIPVVSTSHKVGAALAQSKATVHLKTDTISETRTTHNVIAESRWGDPGKVVMVGAHLDSVEEGPGINDNASGSAAVLAVAEALAQTKTRNRLRFAWWGAEELGLVGSTHYVETLLDADRRRIALYLNFDMIASPNGAIKIYEGTKSKAGELPPGSAEIERLFQSYFAARRQPYGRADLNDRSDYASFRKAGIPTGGIFTGAGESKTAEEAKLFGGTAGRPYDPCYHRSCDTLTNINHQILPVTTAAIATATVVYAFAPNPPEADM